MKIYLSNYRDHWISPYTIAEKLCFWREISFSEPWVRRFATTLEPVCLAINKTLDVVHPKINYIKIDRWDTWNMDDTLAKIIHPMLLQLKQDKHGCPVVDLEDVPKRLHPSKKYKAMPPHDAFDDPNFQKRWDYVLDEMIWTFDQIRLGGNDEQFYIDYGKMDLDFEKDVMVWTKKPKINRKGLLAHHDRIKNGTRLFGKYYSCLWD